MEIAQAVEIKPCQEEIELAGTFELVGMDQVEVSERLKGSRADRFYILRFTEAVVFGPDPDIEEILLKQGLESRSENLAVGLIQLSLGQDSHDESEIEKLLGRHVHILGTAFQGFSVHHATRMVMVVNRMKPGTPDPSSPHSCSSECPVLSPKP